MGDIKERLRYETLNATALTDGTCVMPEKSLSDKKSSKELQLLLQR